MTFVITQGCCDDASCVSVCPVQCIRPRPGDPDFKTTEQLYIDPATCIDCGACMDECPVNAIYPEWDLPDQHSEFLEINSDYFAMNPNAVCSPPQSPTRSLPAERPSLSVAVVGTGPAGCYAATELSDINGVTVSIFDRLPTPFGLVRSGVAPDHAATKQITKRFNGLFSRPNVQAYLNVEVGRDINVSELLEHHHAVIWAVGASDDRKLGITGEDLPGCVSAREFVAWYNGHPDAVDHRYDLESKRVVVIGNGNVAVDVARLLARPVGSLARTDAADHAIEAFRASAVEEVVVTARRGPESAAYTTGEMVGLRHVDGVQLAVHEDEVNDAVASSPLVARTVGRIFQPATSGQDRTITFRYGLTPCAINGDERVRSVTFRRPDGTNEEIETGLVIRAIGFRGRRVDGLPFDERAGVVPNVAGSVHDPETGEPVVGVYCTGWIKRGATGVIGTNKVDSAETIGSLLSDFAAGRLPTPVGGQDILAALLHERKPDLVDGEGWQRIDRAERKAGRKARRPRQKLVTIAELLAASRRE
ncbi:FAD-dependent oxidoreductase [Nocardia jiangxiensis]|uniref:FAD-dependent oxidoreductase n=1 Tax=Nocardia jiangxiensis TaxID=282685 RepID=UPI0002D53404|nr:FAD-dependent oxidoreductase [Nocardia jiangxiensis]